MKYNIFLNIVIQKMCFSFKFSILEIDEYHKPGILNIIVHRWFKVDCYFFTQISKELFTTSIQRDNFPGISL
jgi:hypothetical protein